MNQAFQAVSEAVLIVDATSLKVVDSNPAADRAFGDGQAALARRTVLSAVERAPDGLVVTDPGGCVLYANARFAEMAQMNRPSAWWANRSTAGSGARGSTWVC